MLHPFPGVTENLGGGCGQVVEVNGEVREFCEMAGAGVGKYG